ncbi:MAG: type II secretion system protein J, partial [Wenzhouxiangellaceae bacterium]
NRSGNRFGNSPGSSGFTLVEVLVAVLIFGLLASISYGALQSLVAASARQNQRSIDLAEVQRAVAALDSDLRQLVSRAGREPDGKMSP